MTSEARVAANRRNAARSTGPKTAEGKAIVAQNAVKHGLWARQAVIKDEDPQEFELHRRRMLDKLAPDGPDEEATAERIVALWWRLKRAERMQDEALDYLIEADRGDDWVKHLRSEGDPSAKAELRFGRVVARDFANARTLDRLTMHERRIESSLYRTMGELRRLQGAGKAKPLVETQDFASPQGIAMNDPCCAKQSQSGEVSGSTPAPGGDPSRGRLGHMGVDPSCETKPTEAGKALCSMPCGASVPARPWSCGDAQPTKETPDGVTTNGADSSKQSQFAASQGGHSVSCEVVKQSQPVAAEGGHGSPCEVAKQSQRRASAGAAGAVLRPRPPVACHHHNIARSY